MAKWKAIKIKNLPNPDKFVDDVAPKLEAQLKEAQQDFQDFVGTWRHKPAIKLKTTKKKNSIEVFTGVTSSWTPGKAPKPEDLMLFIARGTKKRYAKMTHDFIPKTAKGVIKSGSGRGGFLRKSTVPLKGIESRDIEKTVRRKQEKRIIKNFKREVIASVRRTGGTI